MKQRRSFTLIFPEFGYKSLLVTAFVSIYFFFLPRASAQHANLDIPLSMGEKETSHPPTHPRSATVRRSIKGIVTDNKGDSLVGVSVRVQLDNEKTATVSDENGEFYFEIPSSWQENSDPNIMGKWGILYDNNREKRLSLWQKFSGAINSILS